MIENKETFDAMVDDMLDAGQFQAMSCASNAMAPLMKELHRLGESLSRVECNPRHRLQAMIGAPFIASLIAVDRFCGDAASLSDDEKNNVVGFIHQIVDQSIEETLGWVSSRKKEKTDD